MIIWVPWQILVFNMEYMCSCKFKSGRMISWELKTIWLYIQRTWENHRKLFTKNMVRNNLLLTSHQRGHQEIAGGHSLGIHSFGLYMVTWPVMKVAIIMKLFKMLHYMLNENVYSLYFWVAFSDYSYSVVTEPLYCFLVHWLPNS